jgi:RNA polymerase sigma-70 factor (ECF subfamily)
MVVEGQEGWMRDALEEILDRFGDGLHHYLLGQTRRADVAEDLVQSVLLRLVRSRERLGAVENLRAYVFTAARNELIRHRSRREEPDAAVPAELLATPDDGPDLEDLEALRAAVAALSPARLEVVSLRIWQGLSFREIGEVLDISPNTAASRYRHALADLRGRMEAPHGR